MLGPDMCVSLGETDGEPGSWRDQDIQINFQRNCTIWGLTERFFCMCVRQLDMKGSRASYWIDLLSKVSYCRIHIYVFIYAYISC